jgi:hypothetical protein
VIIAGQPLDGDAPSSDTPLTRFAGEVSGWAWRVRWTVGVIAVGPLLYAAVVSMIDAATDLGAGSQRMAAAGAIAVALVRIHARFQRWVDRHVYGDTAHPEVVLTGRSGNIGYPGLCVLRPRRPEHAEGRGDTSHR